MDSMKKLESILVSSTRKEQYLLDKLQEIKQFITDNRLALVEASGRNPDVQGAINDIRESAHIVREGIARQIEKKWIPKLEIIGTGLAKYHGRAGVSS